MGNIPEAAWAFFGIALGALSQFLIARSTNAATIQQKNRQDDRDYIKGIIDNKDLECQRLRDDLKAERELRAMEQARADRYLQMLLDDEHTMRKAAEVLNLQAGQQTGGAA